MREELKPCPFCGGEARLIEMQGISEIYCAKCCISTGQCRENTAINRWNTRPVEDALKAEIDGLNIELAIQRKLTSKMCFSIGDTVWYGYPEPKKDKITRVIITERNILYALDNRECEVVDVFKTEKEARIKGIKAELECRKKHVTELEKKLEELEK